MEIALSAESKIKKKTDRNVHRRSYLYSLSVNGAILGYDMTMEEGMTKEETYDTHVYVEGRQRPLPVGMYTDEHSEICSIRFSNSFTLNVVSPQDLIDLAREIETFAKRAHDLHYPDLVPPYDPEDTVAQTMAAEEDFIQAGIDGREQAKSDKMMRGTVSPPIYNPSDPVNW